MRKAKSWLLIAGAVVVLAANVNAQKSAPTLTAQDYIDIQQLLNRYAFALDTCSNNGYDYADLYTPDGVFYWGINSRKSVGREELAEAAGGGKLGCKRAKSATLENPIQGHITVNAVIEPSPEGAIGKSYLVYPGEQRHHRPRPGTPRPRRRLPGRVREDGQRLAHQEAHPHLPAERPGHLRIPG